MHVVQAERVGAVRAADSREYIVVDESKAGITFKINSREFHFEAGILHIAKFVQTESLVAADVTRFRTRSRCVLPLSFRGKLILKTVALQRSLMSQSLAESIRVSPWNTVVATIAQTVLVPVSHVFAGLEKSRKLQPAAIGEVLLKSLRAAA